MSNLDRRARYAVAIAAIAMTAAACGGSSSGGNTATVKPQSGSTQGAGAVVTVHSGPLGKYLTDSKGMTLYVFANDTGSTSTCNGSCASAWPPLTSSGNATASGGATAGMLGTTKRTDGTTQVTYAGHPLYYYSGDSAAGDTNGQGSTNFGGLWSVVAPTGTPITASQSSSAPSPSSTGSSGNGWG